MRKKLIALVCAGAMAAGLAACSSTNTATEETTDPMQATAHLYYEADEVSAENAAELRAAAKAEAESTPADTVEQEILNRLVIAWGDWQPDYEGWLDWSNSLYTPEASITAIGGTQTFADYQASMEQQRSACDMEMGPIMNITVSGNEAALVYLMYLTPKGTGQTFAMMITEYNTFEMVDGQLMVTDLHLYTDGGGMY